MIAENEIVTVIRSKSVDEDRYGNPRPDWSDVDTFGDLPAQVQPMNSEEAVQDRDTLTTHLHLWAEWSQQTLLYTDRVMVRGGTYEVDGAVDVENLGGVPHHVHAVLKWVK